MVHASEQIVYTLFQCGVLFCYSVEAPAIIFVQSIHNLGFCKGSEKKHIFDKCCAMHRSAHLIAYLEKEIKVAAFVCTLECV